jgi:hypothetical protein
MTAALVSLQPAPHKEVIAPVDSLDIGRPVLDRLCQMTRVDKVKIIFAERPNGLGIVDLEFAIWRDPQRLYRAEIGSDDFCTGEGAAISSTISSTISHGGGGCGKAYSAASIAQMPVPVPTSRIL